METKSSGKLKINPFSKFRVNPDIFRLYDIRGIYPADLNEKMAYAIGRCFARFLRKTSKKKKLTIAVGRDIRVSSPILFKGFSRALNLEGCDIVDLGLIATPMLYFSVNRFKYDGGVIITASHNPNPYNGLKLTREMAIPLSGEKGIFWMRNCILKNGDFSKAGSKTKGKIIKKNIEKEYVDFAVKLAAVKRGEFKGLSIVLDAGNGVGGPIAMKIMRAAGLKVYPLYINPDGRFPNHVPDPVLKENLEDVIELVKQKKPILGVALDGDADRIIFIDETGQPISGDLITGVMGKIILRNRKGGLAPKILYDIRSSNAVGETITEAGGTPISYKIGHALIKEEMRRKNVLFAGEMSGHYYWGGDLFFEIPFFVLLKILKEIKNSGVSLSKIVAPVKRYYHSGEINFEVQNKDEKIREFKNRYKDGKIREIDGLRADFKDWWFLIRASNTEPVLRLVIEAKTKNLLEQKQEELTKFMDAPILFRPLIYGSSKKG